MSLACMLACQLMQHQLLGRSGDRNEAEFSVCAPVAEQGRCTSDLQCDLRGLCSEVVQRLLWMLNARRAAAVAKTCQGELHLHTSEPVPTEVKTLRRWLVLRHAGIALCVCQRLKLLGTRRAQISDGTIWKEACSFRKRLPPISASRSATTMFASFPCASARRRACEPS